MTHILHYFPYKPMTGVCFSS